MQPHKPHLSHLSSLWHLSHTITVTDATIFTTTRCAPCRSLDNRPAVSRQNESQLSSRLTMSLLTRARSGISYHEKGDPLGEQFFSLLPC